VEPLLNENRLLELLNILGRNNLSDLINSMIQQFEDGIPILIEAWVVLDIGAQSHSMAGVSSNLGAERMYSLLNEIEAACKEGDLPRSRVLVELLPAAWQQTHVALKKFFSN
jgi:HPt (histidine-containing phosphotransfer) domain-containing protein